MDALRLAPVHRKTREEHEAETREQPGEALEGCSVSREVRAGGVPIGLRLAMDRTTGESLSHV